MIHEVKYVNRNCASNLDVIFILVFLRVLKCKYPCIINMFLKIAFKMHLELNINTKKGYNVRQTGHIALYGLLIIYALKAN